MRRTPLSMEISPSSSVSQCTLKSPSKFVSSRSGPLRQCCDGEPLIFWPHSIALFWALLPSPLPRVLHSKCTLFANTQHEASSFDNKTSKEKEKSMEKATQKSGFREKEGKGPHFWEQKPGEFHAGMENNRREGTNAAAI